MLLKSANSIANRIASLGLLLPNYRDEYWRNNIGAAQANSPVKLTGSMYALAGYTWSCCNKSANDWGCLDVPHTISQEQIDNEREAVRGSRAIAETAKLHEAFCDLISREKGPHVCIACGAIFLDYFNTKQSCGGKNHVKSKSWAPLELSSLVLWVNTYQCSPTTTPQTSPSCTVPSRARYDV